MNESEVVATGQTGQTGSNEVVRIQEILDHHRRRQDRLRWISRGLTLAIFVVFGLYSLAFYGTFKENLAPEKFTESIQSHTAQLAPVVTDASIEVMVGVSPVFADLAARKAETLAPVFLAALEKHGDKFVAEMARFGQDEFKKRLTNILNNVAKEFKKQYPDLTDEQIEKFIEESEDDLRFAFTEMAEHIVAESLPHIMEMKYLAESMAGPNQPQDEMELIRLFLHKLLQRVDKEIVEG